MPGRMSRTLARGEDSSIFLCTTFCRLTFEYKAQTALASLCPVSCLATFPVLPVSGDDGLGSQLLAGLHADLDSGQCTRSSQLLSFAGGRVGFVIRGAVQAHARPAVGLFQNCDDNLC